MRFPPTFVVCLTVCAAFAGGCGTGDGVESTERATSWARVCIDSDGDGFGPHCEAGSDCDDEDAAVQTGCAACAKPDLGCECVPGTEAVSCTLDASVTAEGSLLCLSGVRYCRDGAWTSCQGVAQFEVPAPDTDWVDDRIEAERDLDTSALRCDPCQEQWGELHDGR